MLKIVPLAMFTKESGNPPIPSKPVDPASPDSVNAAPAYKNELPRVITNGLTCVIMINSPFMAPAIAPAASPDKIANQMLAVLIHTRPVTTAESPIVEPIEISMPPETMIIVIGSAAIARYKKSPML
ncbi:MAG: hypothetical protein P8X90_16510 [Desulfobacterales bacterium]